MDVYLGFSFLSFLSAALKQNKQKTEIIKILEREMKELFKNEVSKFFPHVTHILEQRINCWNNFQLHLIIFHSQLLTDLINELKSFPDS